MKILNIMKVDPAKINKADERFQKFTEIVTARQDLLPDEFIKCARPFEDSYKKLKLPELACERFFDLAQKFTEMGKLDLAGIICSRLVKFTNIPFETKEKYILLALDIAEKQNDKIHSAARLEDLHKGYEENDDIAKLLKCLTKEENVLKDIVNDFDTAQKNFRTILYKNEEIENFENILATVQVDIAKFIIRKKPKKAAQKLQDAMKFFDRIGDRDRYEFAEKMLLRANYYREVGKTSKRNRC